MTTEGEGTGEGTQTGAGTGQTQTQPAWISQLPSDLKSNETFTPFKTIGDLGKSYLDTVGKVKEYEGKVKELEGKVVSSIPKLTDKSTDEEKAAYRKEMGIPDKPDGYEFPKVDGTERSPEMESWAKNTFHQANLNKEQAAIISQAWDGFVKGMVQHQEETAKKTLEEGEKKFRAEFENDEKYKAAVEVTKRFWNKVSNTDMNKFCEDTGLGNNPIFIKFVYEIAKKTGEDTSLISSGRVGDLKKEIVYDKSPPPPRQEVR